jgi:hypothetical protein
MAACPFRDWFFARNPLWLSLTQHHPDCDIRNEKKKKITALYKGHSVIIQQIVFVPRYLKQPGMNCIARITAEHKKDKPDRNENDADNKAPDQNAGKNFQAAYET